MTDATEHSVAKAAMLDMTRIILRAHAEEAERRRLFMRAIAKAIRADIAAQIAEDYGHAIPNQGVDPLNPHGDPPEANPFHPDHVDATRNRVALEPCFALIPQDEQHTAVCSVCRAHFTVMTELHQKAAACTGCILRTMRPYDYTRPS